LGSVTLVRFFKRLFIFYISQLTLFFIDCH